MMSMVSDCDQLSSSLSDSSPIKSPLITQSSMASGNYQQTAVGHHLPMFKHYQTSMRRPDDGHSALSVADDYISDEAENGHNGSECGSRSSVASLATSHYYERPNHLGLRRPASGHSNHQLSAHHHLLDQHHSSFHHLNIPLPAPPPPLPPERTHRPFLNHQPHYARPPTQQELDSLHAAQQTLSFQFTLPHRLQNGHGNVNHPLAPHQATGTGTGHPGYRSFARSRSRSGLYSEFRS